MLMENRGRALVSPLALAYAHTHTTKMGLVFQKGDTTHPRIAAAECWPDADPPPHTSPSRPKNGGWLRPLQIGRASPHQKLRAEVGCEVVQLLVDELPCKKLLLTRDVARVEAARVEGVCLVVASIRLPRHSITPARFGDSGEHAPDEGAETTPAICLLDENVLDIQRRPAPRPVRVLEDHVADRRLLHLDKEDMECTAAKGLSNVGCCGAQVVLGVMDCGH
jgi:hypothetical protein